MDTNDDSSITLDPRAELSRLFRANPDKVDCERSQRRIALAKRVAALPEAQIWDLKSKVSEQLMLLLWEPDDAIDAAGFVVANGLFPDWYLRDLEEFRTFDLFISQGLMDVAMDVAEEAAAMAWETPDDWPLEEDVARGPDEVHVDGRALAQHVHEMVEKHLGRG